MPLSRVRYWYSQCQLATGVDLDECILLINEYTRERFPDNKRCLTAIFDQMLF